MGALLRRNKSLMIMVQARVEHAEIPKMIQITPPKPWALIIVSPFDCADVLVIVVDGHNAGDPPRLVTEFVHGRHVIGHCATITSVGSSPPIGWFRAAGYDDRRASMYRSIRS